jgi:relaxase/mobilization nuclease domain protein
MIVSILYSSPTFEAVDYNERKVANGVASLLVAENMGYLEEGQVHSANQLRQQLIDYSSQNERITKPQMHVAFSCRGDEMNNDELVDFAHKWLKEMGYVESTSKCKIAIFFRRTHFWVFQNSVSVRVYY